MTTIATSDVQTLERVCTTTIAEAASAVDRNGSFPSDSISALSAAGLLGAFSSPEAGGLGLGLAGAARIVRRVAEECGSTAMVLTMHYCGVAVLEAHGPMQVRRRAAQDAHLSTLAFSEAGSRSHFWAPVEHRRGANGDGRPQRAQELGHLGVATPTATSGRRKPLAGGRR